MAAYALDCAFTFIDPVAAKQLGYEGMIRYFAREGSQTHPKLWTKEQVARVHDAGMWVGGVYEGNADDPLMGHDRGVQDVDVAQTEWDALGAPAGSVLGMAYDFDPRPDQVVPYAEGVREGDTERFPIMSYCSDAVAVDLFKRKLTDYFWQTESQGFSGRWPSPIAHIIQHTAYDLRPKLNGDYDENVLHPEVGTVPWWYPPGQGGDEVTDDDVKKIVDALRPVIIREVADALTGAHDPSYHSHFQDAVTADKMTPQMAADIAAIKAKVGA